MRCGAFVVGLMLVGAGCVTGTPYQRAMALQEGRAGMDEINRSLLDQNWKLRCLAARACGSSTDIQCSDRVRHLVATDPDENVRACALEGLAARCEHGGREALAVITDESLPNPGRVPVAALIEAIVSCPSPDGILALAKGNGEEFRDALTRVTATPELPMEARERATFLTKIADLPGPKLKVEAALADARERVRQHEAEDSARRAQQRQDEQQRQHSVANALAAAERLLDSEDLEAAEVSIDEAERLGANVAALRGRLEEARTKKGRAHLAAAWRFVKKDRPDEADEERQKAAALGVEDEKLTDAIEQTPTMRRRVREAEAEERRQAKEEERERLREERTRWLAERRCAAGRASCKRAEQACGKTFRVLVGDLDDSDFGRSIGGRVQALNAGMREVGLTRSKKESWAQDVPPLVRVLRKNRADFVAYCAAQMGKIIAPCEPYEFGTRAYTLCIQERQPEFACFTDRGPWRYLVGLKQGTLNEDQDILAKLMIAVADARPYCSEVE